MNMDFNCVGCFTCIHFENKVNEGDAQLRGLKNYWCNKYDKKVSFLNRDSCYCVDYEIKDGYSNRNACANCFLYKMCDAINKFRGLI